MCFSEKPHDFSEKSMISACLAVEAGQYTVFEIKMSDVFDFALTVSQIHDLYKYNRIPEHP
jgi:hypothetical protein